MRDAGMPPNPYSRGRGSNFRPLLPQQKGPGRVQGIISGSEGLIGSIAVQALEAGLGFLLSPTRDRGAVSVILYDGDSPKQAYAASPEEFAAAMDAIQAYCQGKMGHGLSRALNGRQ